MKDSTTRIDAWVARMQGEAVSPITARLVTPVGGVDTAIVNQFKNTTESLVAMETSVRGLLGGAGVPTIQYPFYLCYARELWALMTKGWTAAIGGSNVGSIEAAAIKAKWQTRGLNSAVLNGIFLDVFGIAGTIPTPVRTQPLPNTGVVLPYAFSWNAVTDATKYHIKIFVGGTSVIAYEDNNVVETHKDITNVEVPVSGLYDWTVAAYVAAWGSFATPNWSVFINAG